jgi:hypothetical protein
MPLGRWPREELRHLTRVVRERDPRCDLLADSRPVRQQDVSQELAFERDDPGLDRLELRLDDEQERTPPLPHRLLVHRRLTIADLAATEEMLSKQLADVSVVSAGPAPSRLVAVIDQVLDLWPEMTGAERNRALRSVVRRVNVRYPSRWHEPPADRIDVEFVF